MRKFFRQNKRVGFTFIELMFAVVLLSFGLIAIMRSFMITIDSMNRTEHILAASKFLEDKMEELKQTTKENNGIAPGRTAGQFESEKKKDFSWELSVLPSGISDELNEAKLIISWKERNKPQRLVTATYLKNIEEK